MSFVREVREIYRAAIGKPFALPVLKALNPLDLGLRVPDAGWLDCEAKQIPDPHGRWAESAPTLRRGPGGIMLDAANTTRANRYDGRRGCLLINELQDTATKVVPVIIAEAPKPEAPAATASAVSTEEHAPVKLDDARKKKARP